TRQTRPKMKSPIYLLTVLLPLASALAAAPPADPDPDDFDSVQEFQEFEERDLDDRQFKGPCRVNKPYFYWKYPCDSSDRIGRQNVGGQFTATCSYRQVKPT
ncbi:unnamed protein product, partial [Penicillium discolor]